ncbi:uncharacterized protein [Primulina eburnea]|uniref:uncharacterized protein n=1 Tax=Primulina eburnea TaxID=1245227 RepID=UPI003C6C8B10
MIPGLKEWDVELLHALFNERGITQITNIPLVGSNHEDVRIWHYSENGVYTVKSGYKLAMDISLNEEIQVQEGWKNLWALKLPPNRVGQSSKKENPGASSESFNELFFMLLSQMQGFTQSKFCMVLWNIWRQRNDKVWNDTFNDPSTTVRLALKFLCDWLRAKQLSQEIADAHSLESGCPDWHKPPRLAIKCNVDAAFFPVDQKIGIGCILRNENGKFLRCRTCVIVGAFSVKEGEAMGLLEALSWVRRLGLKKVYFEMDAKGVVEAIKASDVGISEFGFIVKSCKDIIRYMDTVRALLYAGGYVIIEDDDDSLQFMFEFPTLDCMYLYVDSSPLLQNVSDYDFDAVMPVITQGLGTIGLNEAGPSMYHVDEQSAQTYSGIDTSPWDHCITAYTEEDYA